MPNAEYHKAPSLSCSGLKHFIKSPAHYKNYINGKKDDEPTNAMIIGSYTHTITLEPNNISQYVIAPEGMSFAKKEGIQFKKDNANKEIIKYDDDIIAKNISKQLNDNAMCKTILSGGIAESSIFWTDEESGVNIRCRPDYLNSELKIIVDLKTTIDASPEAFPKSAWGMQYHLQAAFYQKGVFQQFGEWYDFLFIAIEKGNPYLQPVIYKPDHELLKYSDMVINEQLKKFAECLHTDEWTGYSEKVISLSMPAWAKV